tara:strand:+ start:2325 stop:2864 length:540 start_codon:yes stop_codon:yes gene_type:complete
MKSLKKLLALSFLLTTFNVSSQSQNFTGTAYYVKEIQNWANTTVPGQFGGFVFKPAASDNYAQNITVFFDESTQFYSNVKAVQVENGTSLQTVVHRVSPILINYNSEGSNGEPSAFCLLKLQYDEPMGIFSTGAYIGIHGGTASAGFDTITNPEKVFIFLNSNYLNADIIGCTEYKSEE